MTLALSLPMDAAYSQSGADQPYMMLGGSAPAPAGLRQFCTRKPARCTPAKEEVRIFLDRHADELQRIHHEVNLAIEPRARPSQGPVPPWDDEARFGDCNDFALTKRSRLLDLGYASSALLLAIAFLPTGEGHLVLVVVTDQGDFVLDNLRLSIVRWDKLPYRWVRRSTPKNILHWQGIASSIPVAEANELLGLRRPVNPCG